VNLRLRAVPTLAEALERLAFLERAARESAATLGEPVREGTAKSFLERHFGRLETALVFAEERSGADPLGVAASGPFEDPLSGLVRPLLVMLWVEPRVRRRGIARALWQELARQLRGREALGLVMRAGTNDDALISMGERWGLVRQWELLSGE
jgi:GNAT superfamily N-acetyltransferase